MIYNKKNIGNDQKNPSIRTQILKSIFLIFALSFTVVAFSGASVFAQSSPKVTEYGPSGLQTSVTKVVYAVFDSLMDETTLTAQNFKVSVNGSANTVQGGVYYDSLNKHLAFFPIDKFAGNTQYNVVLTTSITDKDGRPLAENFTWSFTTGQYYSPHDTYLMNTNDCSICHATHTALAPNLLKQEDETSLCVTCHDGTGSVYNTLYGFQPVGQDWTTHPVGNTGNTSKNTGIKCTDCHNPHESNGNPPTVRNQVYSGPLAGASGVGVNWNDVLPGDTPLAPQNFLNKSRSELEADICLKCHSNYGQIPNGLTNQAVEFNPRNFSTHPIYGLGTNSYTIPHTVDNVVYTTMEAPFNQTTEHTILKCTDCHGSNTTASTFQGSINEQNLHGSINKHMLKKDSGDNGLCLLCHRKTVYVDATQDAEGSHFKGSVYSSVYAPDYDLAFPYKPDFKGALHPKHSSLKCLDCHGGTQKTGLIHGTNAKYGDLGFVSASPTPAEKIRYFLFGPGITGRNDTGTTATCYTSGCH
ncbi:MAG: cytochrome c3 family protein [Desulfitobacteriaceae bacterium]